MSVKLIGSVVQATINDKDCRGGLSLYLSQPVSDAIHWSFTVYAQTDEGLMEVGTIINSLPTQLVGTDADRQASRIIAIAAVPGAWSWTVIAKKVDPEAIDDTSEMTMAVGEMVGPPGLSRISERYAHYSGVDGAVALAPGDRVVGWAAVASPAGAGVAITPSTLPGIVIPPNGTIAGSTGGNLVGPITITFVNTIAYLVEVARSA